MPFGFCGGRQGVGPHLVISSSTSSTVGSPLVGSCSTSTVCCGRDSPAVREETQERKESYDLHMLSILVLLAEIERESLRRGETSLREEVR